MPLDNQFDTRPAMGALSSRDGRASLSIDDEIKLSIQLADLSKGFAAESVEGRVFVAVRSQFMEVRALRKPVIIEEVTCDIDVALAFFYFQIDTPRVTGGMGAANRVDIGGADTTLQVHVGGLLPAIGSNVAIIFESWAFGSEFRAYVEPGQSFQLLAVAAGTLDVKLVAREVADIPKTRG